MAIAIIFNSSELVQVKTRREYSILVTPKS